MNTKHLKAKILDLAIRGKLVPQDSSEGNATDLLQKIRDEKTELVKQKKIKEDKNTSFIIKAEDGKHYEQYADGSLKDIEDEIPFEIPENWCWCKGKSVFLPMTSRLPSGDEFKYIDIETVDNKLHKVHHPKIIKTENAPSRASRETLVGDTVFSMVRPYLTNIALITEDLSDCIASTGFYICRPNKTLNSVYLYYLMISDYVVNGLNQFMKGDNSPSINGDDITEFYYPLPPLSEQKRIVSAIEKAFEQIDIIKKNKLNLKTYIKQTKSKVLDLAIHGKLVEQNPQEGNAFELLEKIRNEKAELIKQKKLKEDKNASFIIKADNGKHYEQFADGSLKDVEEEIPFEIPENWCWCRIFECSECKDNCRRPINADERSNRKGNIPYYGATGQVGWINDYLTDETLVLVGEDGAPFLDAYKEKSYIINGKAWVNNHAHLIKTNDDTLSSKYLCHCLNKTDYQNLVTGSTRLKLTQSSLEKILIPLPPLSEQNRIVAKIEQVFEQLDVLEKSLGE